MKNWFLLPQLWLALASGRGVVDRRTGEIRILQDDDITSEIPNISADDFSINDMGEGDVCTIGCEGNYTIFREVYNGIWKDRDEEVELFFVTKGRFAVAAGVIYDNFPVRIQALNEAHPEVDTLILFECPGSADDDRLVEGSILARGLGYQTCVPSDGHTASGGTDFFTSGVKRYATTGAQIGVHSWAVGDRENEIVGSNLPRDHEEHLLYLDFYDAICIPRDFYWQTLIHGLPMHYITEEEVVSTFPYLRSCTGVCESGEDIFHRTIANRMRDEGIRGAAYAFRGPGMSAPVLGSYGQISGAEDAPLVDLDTSFMLASVAKPFTGATVAVMVDQGIIGLDDDICATTGNVSTACRNPQYPDIPVTWRMLMTHRSSINRDYPFLPDWTDAAMAPAGVNIYGARASGNPTCPIDDIERFYEDLFVDQPSTTTVGQANGLLVNWYDLAEDYMGGQWNTTYEPGEYYAYSNVGASYPAALLPKAIPGTDFNEFFQVHITSKIGMNNTAWFREALPNNTRVAMPVHRLDNQTGTWEDIGHYCWANYADGQLYSSIRDMVAYAETMTSYGIGTLWSNETAMEHVFGCQVKDETGTLLLDTDPDCDLSLAWFYISNQMKGESGSWVSFFLGNGSWASLDWTNGVTHDGSYGGVETNVLILPEENSYVIVLMNTDSADSFYFLEGILETGMNFLLDMGNGTFPEQDHDDDDTFFTRIINVGLSIYDFLSKTVSSIVN